ncbi:MAG: S9 family peptidase, partial [Phycisphaerae bacterium]|nr:S9 family peptidase [Phycisphaerae bacterium]
PAIWSADGQRIYFLVGENGSAHLYTRSLGRRDTRCVVDGDINLMFFSRTANTGLIALNIGTFANPADVFVFDPDSGETRQITEVNAGVLKRVHVAEREAFTVKSGNTTVPGWIIKPPNFSKARRYPAILEVHGGPHGAYGSTFFHEFQLLAASGYVVCWSNPRGSTTYGLKYRNCINADWGNLDWKDVSKVADHLFRQRYVDSKRVGFTGGSYGGYMTNWAVGHTQRFRAAVTQRSVTNLESMFGTSDYGNELGFHFGGKPWEKMKEYRRQSPLTFVKNIKTPLLVIHSEQDLRCGIEQAEQLFTSLKVMGRETEMVRFEGESHGLSRGGRPQNRAERLRRIVGWFNKHMR